jgi:lysophospholipase L1-like esterase
MADRLSLRAKLLTLTVTSIITITALAAIGEVAVRYRERNRSTIPGTMSMLFYRHARLGHALVRDNDYFGWIHVGAHGFRGRDTIDLRKPPGTLRVIVDGGSTTFDTFVSSDEHAWPARLQQWLNQLAPERNIEVVNAGVPGYRVRDNLIRLLGELADYQPDLLIQLQGHNDLYAALATPTCDQMTAEKTPGAMPIITPWQHWFEQHSLLYNKLIGKLQAIPRIRRQRAQPTSPLRSFSDRLDCGARRFDRDIRAYLSVASALDVPVVLIEPVHVGADQNEPGILEMWRNALPGVAPDTVIEGYRRYADLLQRAALEGSSIFISTQGFGLRGERWYYEGDPIHFNDAGADRMAECVARALLASRIIESEVAAEAIAPTCT